MLEFYLLASFSPNLIPSPAISHTSPRWCQAASARVPVITKNGRKQLLIATENSNTCTPPNTQFGFGFHVLSLCLESSNTRYSLSVTSDQMHWMKSNVVCKSVAIRTESLGSFLHLVFTECRTQTTQAAQQRRAETQFRSILSDSVHLHVTNYVVVLAWTLMKGRTHTLSQGSSRAPESCLGRALQLTSVVSAEQPQLSTRCLSKEAWSTWVHITHP